VEPRIAISQKVLREPTQPCKYSLSEIRATECPVIWTGYVGFLHDKVWNGFLAYILKCDQCYPVDVFTAGSLL
jgi:hypothetical protein